MRFRNASALLDAGQVARDKESKPRLRTRGPSRDDMITGSVLFPEHRGALRRCAAGLGREADTRRLIVSPDRPAKKIPRPEAGSVCARASI